MKTLLTFIFGLMLIAAGLFCLWNLAFAEIHWGWKIIHGLLGIGMLDYGIEKLDKATL